MKEEADRRKAMDAKEAETLAPGTPPQGENYRTEPRILDASLMTKRETRVGYIGFELGVRHRTQEGMATEVHRRKEEEMAKGIGNSSL